MTWRRETGAEMASAQKTKEELEEIAQDMMVCRTFVGGLCFPGSEEEKEYSNLGQACLFQRSSTSRCELTRTELRDGAH
ncbi:hypothetical protein ElyMa_001181700 [Elysia marginata]|uniref:Uncharacterized protein n=1 Tax=Elysia marginata TaxID=1093978 RepID=A0AAV4I6D3_9GAST|nr:hypothetical protein ElyMa_001181700 [Elysia marginata]